jgi:hypothetical protein
MSGVAAAAEAQASRSKADWLSYREMLRKDSADPGDVEQLHALATKLGRADSLALDHEAVRRFDLAKSKIAPGLLKAIDSTKYAAAIHKQETTPQAIQALKDRHAAELANLQASKAADQAKLDEEVFHAQNAYKAGADAIDQINASLRTSGQLFADQEPLSVSVLK